MSNEYKKISSSSINVYRPVDWKDGITPINSINLNNSEKALLDLLGQTGYIFQIIDELENHSEDLINHKETIDDNSSSVNDLKTQLLKLQAKLNSIETTHLQDTTELNNAINDLNDALKNYCNSTDFENFKEEAKSVHEQIKKSIETIEKTIESGMNGNINLDNYYTKVETDELISTFEEDIIQETDKLILNCGSSTEVLH